MSITIPAFWVGVFVGALGMLVFIVSYALIHVRRPVGK